MISVSMKHFKNIRKEFEIEMRCGCQESRRNFSTKFKYIIFELKTSVMSTNRETYENFVQIVENFIHFDLIDKAVAELQLGVVSAKENITIKMN